MIGYIIISIISILLYCFAALKLFFNREADKKIKDRYWSLLSFATVIFLGGNLFLAIILKLIS